MVNNILKKPGKIEFLLYFFPGIIVYFFVVVIPIFVSFRYSFFEWSGGKKETFIGLGNYFELITTKDFWSALNNNLLIIVFCILGQIGIAFLLATFMNSRHLRFKNIHRTVIFLPVVLSAVVIGFLWSIMYNQNAGLINLFLESIGKSHWIRPWLDDPKIVLFAVCIPLIWQYIGFYLVIFMAAYQSIPKSIFEVAEIDGATGLNKIRYISLPLMMNTIKVAIMLCIAGNMKVFDHIFIMTNGGPGNASTVVAQYAYNSSFIKYKLGYGSAVSIAIMIVSLGLIVISRKLGGKSNA